MKFLLPAILGLLLVTLPGHSATDSNRTADPASGSDTNATAEFNSIEAADDAAQNEVDKWIKENNAPKTKGEAIPEAELKRRISERFEAVRKSYEDFVRRHPADARSHLGYGNFLNDRGDELGAQAQWEKALELDPKNPSLYNILAGRYSESGPVDKAFEYFKKAVELSPSEALYYHNFGDSLYVLRKRAMVYYGISEQQVYGKVLLLYSNALRLDPQNFTFARDLAQTYYSFKPLPVEAALGAWTNALNVAHEETDQEDVHIHLARVKMLAGRFDEARAQLGGLTNQASLNAKTALLHNLEERQKDALMGERRPTDTKPTPNR